MNENNKHRFPSYLQDARLDNFNRYRDNLHKIKLKGREDIYTNSGANIFPPGLTEGDASLFHCIPEGLHAIRAVRPGNGPVHHPGDAGLLAAMCQHLAHGLARSHAVGGGQLLLQRPLFSGAGKNGNGRSAGEDLSGDVMLAAGKHQPVIELPVRPCGFPAAVLHRQGHLLQVAGVSVLEGRVHVFISIRTWFWLRGGPTGTPSCLF